MTIDWNKYIPFVKDALERAAKTFAQSFLAVWLVAGVGDDFASVPWVHASEAGIIAVVFSALSSMASLRYGVSGTASLTDAVEPVPPRPGKD